MPTIHDRIRPATKYWQHPHSERSNDNLSFRIKLNRDRYPPPIPQHGLQGKVSSHYEKRKKVTDLTNKDDNPGKGTLREPWTGEIWRETEPDSERLKYAKSPKIERLRCAVQGTKIKIQTPSREINSPSRLWCKNKKFCKETFLNAESGGPPSKEYKQSRAEHSKSSSWLHKRKSF